MISKLKPIISFLQGKKTYIVAGLLTFFGILDLATGQISTSQFLSSGDFSLVMEGLGLASLRAGLSNAISLVLRYLNMIKLNAKEEKEDDKISPEVDQG